MAWIKDSKARRYYLRYKSISSTFRWRTIFWDTSTLVNTIISKDFQVKGQNKLSLEQQLEWNRWKLYNQNSSYNYKIYISKELPGVPKNELFTRTSPHPTLPDVNLISKLNLTSNIRDADYVLVPHAWRNIKNNKEYLAYLKDLSHQTPLLIVNSGDVSSKCTLENVIELRMFLHPWEKADRKIVLPYPVKEKDFVIRKWKPIPRISFMGYVPKLGPGSLFGENFQGLTKPIKSSVYINRKVSVAKLNKLSSKFDVQIQKRSAFTAYASNPILNLHVSEFNTELNKSDYILCPRGSGNTSIRFYETLSSGATPILIDSGGINPEIADNDFWTKNIVNVKLFEKWSYYISKDWSFLSEGQNYEYRQVQNNRVFLNCLKFEVFLEKLFKRYLK